MTSAKARPSTAKAAPPPGEDDGILRIGEDPEEPRYEVKLHVGGKPHKVLVNPPGSLMVEYLHRIRAGGGNLALSWLMEKMLDPAAYAALRSDSKVSDADLRKVMQMCAQIVTGTRPAPKSAAPASPPETS